MTPDVHTLETIGLCVGVGAAGCLILLALASAFEYGYKCGRRDADRWWLRVEKDADISEKNMNQWP
jgi:hypothetical protein